MVTGIVGHKNWWAQEMVGPGTGEHTNLKTHKLVDSRTGGIRNQWGQKLVRL